MSSYVDGDGVDPNSYDSTCPFCEEPDCLGECGPKIDMYYEDRVFKHPEKDIYYCHYCGSYDCDGYCDCP